MIALIPSTDYPPEPSRALRLFNKLSVHLRANRALTLCVNEVEEVCAVAEALHRCQVNVKVAARKLRLGAEGPNMVSTEFVVVKLMDQEVVLDRFGHSGWEEISKSWHKRMLPCYPDPTLRFAELVMGPEITENIHIIDSMQDLGLRYYDDLVAAATVFLQSTEIGQETTSISQQEVALSRARL